MADIGTPPQLNVDRFGLPRDFATYMWLVYRRHVIDGSPARVAFLHGSSTTAYPSFGLQMMWR